MSTNKLGISEHLSEKYNKKWVVLVPRVVDRTLMVIPQAHPWADRR